MHKDQKRVVADILPVIEEATGSTDPQAIRDCILLNRVFNQGVDPLALMELCPEQFGALCGLLGLTVEDGADAIEKAHWQGPAVLLGEGLGIPSLNWENVHRDQMFEENPWRQEALWLLLASMSDCTEDGYRKETSLQERMQRAMQAGIRLASLVDACESRSLDLVRKTMAILKDFEDSTTFTPDKHYPDVPHGGEQDHAFYVGYRKGHQCVSTQSGGLTFYGTIPSTTLAAQGIKVDKEISPAFGIIFGEKPE